VAVGGLQLSSNPQRSVRHTAAQMPLFCAEAPTAHALHESIHVPRRLVCFVAAVLVLPLITRALAIPVFRESPMRATLAGILTPPGGLTKLITQASNCRQAVNEAAPGLPRRSPFNYRKGSYEQSTSFAV
jgi:hypothetical protein